MEALVKLKKQMEEVLDKGDVEQFCKLERKHSGIMHDLARANGGAVPLPLLIKLINENKQLVARGHAQIEVMQKEIVRLRSRRNANKQVSKAYSPPRAAGKYIKGNG